MKVQPHSFTFLDTTSLAAGIHYYDSYRGQKIGSRSFLSLTGYLEDADGTITLTVEGTNDTASPNWVQLYGYDTQNATDVNSIAVTNTATAFAWDFDRFNYIYYRVKVVNNGATNVVKILGRTH